MRIRKLRISLIFVFSLVVLGSISLRPALGLGKRVASNNKTRDLGQLPPKNPMAFEYFSIAMASLDGKDFTVILKDPRRQMSHARVSPDGKWITFTRFNKIDPKKGVAVEDENDYSQTEIMVCRIDGSDIKSIVPPKKGLANCNSYWSPDGKSLIHISTDNDKKKGRIYITDIATGKRTRVPTPEGIDAADPYTNGETVVFPGRQAGPGGHVIHIMKANGSGHRRLSSVPQAKSKGEYDPKISPDKSKVAFMRFGKKGQKGDVHIIVTDIKTGEEKDLSIPGNDNWDAMPEWSSDGKLLVFWHVNRPDVLKSGIYTIRADGKDRKMIPLPFDHQYTIPSFVPGTGSGNDAKIIFTAKRFPVAIRNKLENLKKKQLRL